MNLTISPVKVNPYSIQNNRQNNNSTQQFGMLPAKLSTSSKMNRCSDMVLDKFLFSLENFSKKMGFDTKKLAKKGYILDVTPQAAPEILNGVLKSKNDKVVRRNGKILNCVITDLNESQSAEAFAKLLCANF